MDQEQSTRQIGLVRIESDDRVAHLVLDNPAELNALGREMLDNLTAAAAELNAQPNLQVVVVRGAGRVFTAGADLAAFAPDASMSHAEADAGRIMADAIEAIEAITIAQIHGHCVGGGIVLAAACDLRVAAGDTTFVIPEVAIGIPLAWGGIPRLVREMGPAVTKELVMTCRSFSADEAQAGGFVNRVVPAAELETAVAALTDELLAKPRRPLLATKRHVNAVTRAMTGLDRSWSDADSLLAARNDPDSRKAAEAYLAQLRGRE